MGLEGSPNGRMMIITAAAATSAAAASTAVAAAGAVIKKTAAGCSLSSLVKACQALNQIRQQALTMSQPAGC